MSCTDINSVLLVTLILIGVLALAVWASPLGCRWISLRLYARAEQLDAGRRAFKNTLDANIYAKERVPEKETRD